MVKKHHDWGGEAFLAEHSLRKHKILAEYFDAYLQERCKNPIARSFKLAIVDAFSGPGRYSDGNPGSPTILAETLMDTVEKINKKRNDSGMPEVDVSCLMILNDVDQKAIALLEDEMEPLLARSRAYNSNVKLEVEYFRGKFEDLVDQFENRVNESRCRNVIYNLDQYGYSHVNRSTIIRLINSRRSVEIFLTYAIGAFITYLKQNDVSLLNKRLRHLDMTAESVIPEEIPDMLVKKKEWLGIMERAIFDHFGGCAPFMTPFSVNNPGGWRYWLMHFATSHRARQVYNDVLHKNSSQQAHYGRAGLDMLAYNPNDEKGFLYLFEDNDREHGRHQLPDDIEKVVYESGNVIMMDDFLRIAYNATPAHSDDIYGAIMENGNLEIITQSGRPRRTIGGISLDDALCLTKQPVFDLFKYPTKMAG